MAVLKGIKVIDLSQVAAVPLCARYLADFGADVFDIESPRAGDYFRTFLSSQQELDAAAPSEFDYLWENYNRNKHSITLDIAEPRGREVLDHMVKQSDIFLCNLRASDLKRYRLTYPDMKWYNPSG